MLSSQQASRAHRRAKGWQEVSVPLPPDAAAALARLSAEWGIPKWQVIERLLVPAPSWTAKGRPS